LDVLAVGENKEKRLLLLNNMKKKINSKQKKRKPIQQGQWVVKPLQSTILTCTCGNKYIATRENQTECIRCAYSEVER